MVACSSDRWRSIGRTRVRLRIGVVAVVAHLLSPARSFAQSTSQLGHAERSVRVEVTGGGELHAREAGLGYTHDLSVRSAAVAVRLDRGGSGGFRLALQGYQRRGATSYLVDSATTSHRETNDDVVAATLSSDVVLSVRHDLTFAPSLGIGIVPFIHARESMSPPSSYNRGHIS